MTRLELIKHYKEVLHYKKISFKNERKRYKELFGCDMDSIVINQHEKECLILKETIMALRGYR